MRDEETHVRSLLHSAGLQPAEAEIAILVERYRGLRRSVELLWALELGEEASALVFRAAGSGEEGQP